jgi:hypothetical protein
MLKSKRSDQWLLNVRSILFITLSQSRQPLYLSSALSSRSHCFLIPHPVSPFNFCEKFSMAQVGHGGTIVCQCHRCFSHCPTLKTPYVSLHSTRRLCKFCATVGDPTTARLLTPISLPLFPAGATLPLAHSTASRDRCVA